MGASCGIEKVIATTNEQTIQEVQDNLLDGSQQFWGVTKDGNFIASMITNVDKRETGDILEFRYMAGEKLDAWFDVAADVLKPMAIDAGCVAAYANVREGMRKFMVDRDWKKVSVRMRLDLTDGR